MTTPTTAELRALVAKATPGPWVKDQDGLRAMVRGDDATIVACRHRLPATTNDANISLIVAAVNALPALLDRLEAAELDAERYRWLRNADNWTEAGPMPCVATFDSTIYDDALDRAIDAAREGK